MIRWLSDLLSYPTMYDVFQKMVGIHNIRTRLVGEFITPKHQDSILEIGCGTGGLLPYLPEVSYLGIDISQQYINAANSRFSHLGEFICADLWKWQPNDKKFDIVLALGVFHHIDDQMAIGLSEMAKSVLKPGGRFITSDPCSRPDQSWLSRKILETDRGHFVRNKEGYLSLVTPSFQSTQTFIVHDFNLVPYSYIILEAKQ